MLPLEILHCHARIFMIFAIIPSSVCCLLKIRASIIIQIVHTIAARHVSIPTFFLWVDMIFIISPIFHVLVIFKSNQLLRIFQHFFAKSQSHIKWLNDSTSDSHHGHVGSIRIPLSNKKFRVGSFSCSTFHRKSLIEGGTLMLQSKFHLISLPCMFCRLMYP